jgi:hypothetical protein
MKAPLKVTFAVAMGLAIGLGAILWQRRPAKQAVVLNTTGSTATDSNGNGQIVSQPALPQISHALPQASPMAPVNHLGEIQSAVDAKARRQTLAAQKANKQNISQAPAVTVASTLAAPDARVALSFVGSDPQAQVVWMNAINDPNVPADERKDLIEDLNEDGFPDPHHITNDDIPLVLSRIDLIEQMAPYAMDDVNAAAMGEAYKDLTNMLDDPNPK